MIWLLVIFWLTCAGFSSYIASQKGRDSGAWFLVGLFFGLFALIAIAAVPALDVPNVVEGEHKCPRCRAYNREDAKTCYSCGAAMD